MKFTALIPVTKMVEKSYDLPLSKEEEQMIKAYEKWCDNLTDENEKALIETIKKADEDFNPNEEDFEDYVNEFLYDIRCKIYDEEKYNSDVYELDDIQELAEGDFNFH